MEVVYVYVKKPMRECQKKAQKKWLEKNPNYMKEYRSSHHMDNYRNDEEYRQNYLAANKRYRERQKEIKQLINIDPTIFT